MTSRVLPRMAALVSREARGCASISQTPAPPAMELRMNVAT
jgi:hypothetical protein